MLSRQLPRLPMLIYLFTKINLIAVGYIIYCFNLSILFTVFHLLLDLIYNLIMSCISYLFLYKLKYNKN